MKTQTISIFKNRPLPSILFDIGALVFIYLVPTISHWLKVPLYLIEPMRLMLVFALVYTNKTNAFVIALTMPLFSFLVSGHPVFPKMILVAIELALNVYIFYLLIAKIKSAFPAILLSIVASKVTYYLLKFGLISLAILDTTMISTPIYIQLIMTLVFSSFFVLFYTKKKR